MFLSLERTPGCDNGVKLILKSFSGSVSSTVN
jgi:hypothetical protein